MSLGMERCKKCGAMDMFPNGICSKCGAALGNFPEEELNMKSSSQGKEPSFSMFSESNEKKNGGDTKEALPAPESWMYAVSAFFPVLQWLLVSVYVLKGNNKGAFELWWKSFIVQIAIIVIAVSAIVTLRR